MQTAEAPDTSDRGQADGAEDAVRPEVTTESTEATGPRVRNKRPAEDEADDSSRGDRVDWRYFVEPGSSSQAPSALPSTRETAPLREPESGSTIPGAVAATPVSVGREKRPQ